MKNILQNIILIWGYLFPKSISNIGEELLGEILVDVKNNIYIGKHASLRYDCITDAHWALMICYGYGRLFKWPKN